MSWEELIGGSLQPGMVFIPRCKDPKNTKLKFHGKVLGIPEWKWIREPRVITDIITIRGHQRTSKYVKSVTMFTKQKRPHVALTRASNDKGWNGWPADYRIIPMLVLDLSEYIDASD